MKLRKKMIRGTALVMMAIATMIGLTACIEETASTTSALCAFVVGNGVDNNDAKIHDYIYPGDRVEYNSTDEEVKYFPCNSRNYLINDGTVKNANGSRVGDRKTPSIAYTAGGTKVKVWTSSYWTPNQSKEALAKFYDVLFKYDAFSDEPTSGEANFSTPGWNGMLGENFGPSVDQAAFEAVAKFDDDLWSKPNPDRYKKLGLAMSNVFADKVRAKTGYNVDLFCGSGNSGWDSEKRTKFTCTTVRIIIDAVEPFDKNLTNTASTATKAEQDLKANTKRLAAAKALYGSQAEYWLGLQDTIEKCNVDEGTANCVVSIGAGGGTSPVVVVNGNKSK